MGAASVRSDAIRRTTVAWSEYGDIVQGVRDDHAVERRKVDGSCEIANDRPNRCPRRRGGDAPIELAEGAGIAIDRVHRSGRSEQRGQSAGEHARAGAKISPHAARLRHGRADERDGVAVLHGRGLGAGPFDDAAGLDRLDGERLAGTPSAVAVSV